MGQFKKELWILVISGPILLIGVCFFYIYNNDSFFDEFVYDQRDRSTIINHLLDDTVNVDEKILKDLKDQGLKDPLNDLRKDLYKNRKFIRGKGVLGGVMEYSGEFLILSNTTVSVGFSDGHIDGSMLLKYKINKGHINWTLIEINPK
jgi:hypothetical protein